MRSFLVIGLGGSGGKTIRYLKQSLGEWLGEIGWPSGLPQGWQFLHIDTPSTQEAPLLPGRPELLPPIEYMSLHRDGVPFGTVVERLTRKQTNFDGWWVDPDFMNVPIAHGAGQYRAIGRVLGLDQQERIHTAIQGKITALRTADALGELQRLRATADEEGSGTYEERGEPVLMIVSSLAGGTGAGLFLDIADMLRAEGEQWLDNSFGILYAADVFQSLAAGARAGVHPNTAAALAELLGGVYAGGRVSVAGEEREISRSGPAFSFLVGHANTSGVVFGDQTDVYRVMGRCLSAVMTDPQVQDDFVVYTAANWQSSAGTYGDRGGPMHMLMEPPYVGMLQGLGYAEVDLGVDRFKQYSERRIVRDAVDTLVNGHRLATEGLDRYEGLTPDVIAQELAADRLTGFLKNVEITERGQNQVVDAIALPLRERQVITGGLAEKVYQGAVENVGARGRIDEWLAAIVEEAELLAPGENERYDTRLRERARVWTNEVSGRLLRETGSIASVYGLPVVSELLELVRSEVRAACDDLENERIEFESFSSHVRSNVQSAFGELSGQLGSEHEAVRMAAAQAVDTLVFQRMEEKSRFISRALLLDFDESVVMPLMEAVRLALGDLQRKLDPADVEAAPVDGWPRHNPKRDQAVSDDLIPGKTVAMVIDPKSFPALFDELLTSTLGVDYGAPAERWRTVRHAVVTGNYLVESQPTDRRLGAQVREMFEVVDQWQPSEAILLGGEPDRPARYRLHLERDELVLRARAWLTREGTDFDDFLFQGLRSYLQEPDRKVPAAVVRDRERAFQSALEAAFEAAEPLVHVDPVLLSEVHDRVLTTHAVPGEIPLKNHRLERWVTQFLDSKLADRSDGIHDNVTQSDRVKRISIYSMLEGALHPAVFRSLIDPIADGYAAASRATRLRDFWKWRRSRPLARAIPLPMPMVRALVRGWFIARFLGLLTVVQENGSTLVRVEKGRGGPMIESPPLVTTPGENRPRQLGAFLETLALAIPFAANAGRPDEMLGIFHTLIELGRNPGTVGAEVGEYRELSPVLEEWVSAGTAYGLEAGVPQIEFEEAGKRATALAELVTKLDEDYARHAEEERREGRIGPENSWLGATDLIHEELHRMAVALQVRASQTTPEF
ncbi:MAG TPA: tubulin-like doman-containing protein [Acidimicrobiia bacterium]|nr:tubulin-like doman-containing protein [Acidimicrobiia bacterium]